MDLRIWPEAQTMSGIAEHVDAMPRLIYFSPRPAFQIHEFVSGEVLDVICGRGLPVPEHVLTDVVRFLGQLARVPFTVVPQVPAGWRLTVTPRLCRKAIESHRYESSEISE